MPFALNDSTGLLPEPPPPHLLSGAYANAYNEVKTIGARFNSSRTPEQTDFALFYSDNFGNQLNRAVGAIAAAHLSDVGDSARLFALANIAAADALMSSWNTKRYYALLVKSFGQRGEWFVREVRRSFGWSCTILVLEWARSPKTSKHGYKTNGGDSPRRCNVRASCRGGAHCGRTSTGQGAFTPVNAEMRASFRCSRRLRDPHPASAIDEDSRGGAPTYPNSRRAPGDYAALVRSLSTILPRSSQAIAAANRAYAISAVAAIARSDDGGGLYNMPACITRIATQKTGIA